MVRTTAANATVMIIVRIRNRGIRTVRSPENPSYRLRHHPAPACARIIREPHGFASPGQLRAASSLFLRPEIDAATGDLVVTQNVASDIVVSVEAVTEVGVSESRMLARWIPRFQPQRIIELVPVRLRAQNQMK